MATRKCGNCKGCSSQKCYICDPCLRESLKRGCVEKVCYSRRLIKADIPALVNGILECDARSSASEIHPDEAVSYASSESSDSESADYIGVQKECREEVSLFSISESDFESQSVSQTTQKEGDCAIPFILKGLFKGYVQDDSLLRQSIAEMRKVFAKN